MGFMKKAACMALAAAMVVVAVAPPAEAAIGCSAVIQYLNSCLPYVTNKGPLGGCCGGVQKLYAAARTTPDRQNVCVCLKNIAVVSSVINFNKAAGLPRQCGISIPYKISPSTDCSKVR